MKTYSVLPEGYREILSIDLQKDKKLSIIVNGLAVVIAVCMVVPVCFAVPIKTLFDMNRGLGLYALRFAVLAVSVIAYMILHELVHGITMKCFGCPKVKYGFTGMYAFAGSEAYFAKVPYLAVALAPVVVWGVVLGVLCAVVPIQWFWIVYILEVINISGAAGDFYVTWRFLNLPKDILVQDSGVAMKVYSEN